jgi:RNA polymerase sigma factor (sigma-70 family)
MTGRATRPVPLATDDAAVIEASFSEPDRFASLFDRHAPHIHRYLARRVGRQAADDLVAETFLVAFGKRGAYDPGFRDARPWLYGIATNLVGRHRREEVRQLRLSQAAGPDLVQSDYSERAVVNLTAQSIRAVLADALSGLAEPDRDVLLLIAWEQLSYDEVACALGIPVGTVRSRLHRARTKVRQALAGTPAAATYEEILTNE